MSAATQGGGDPSDADQEGQDKDPRGCDERDWVTRGPEDRSTADIYSGLPQQTSADPTPGCMHAHQGAPDQCYP